MGEQISWHVELGVKPGELKNFCALTREMVKFTRQEEGVLAYERYISEDGAVVHVYERYVDAAAATAHLLAFVQVFGSRFSSMVERRQFTVFGVPTPELQGILDKFGAVYARHLDGFAQLAP